MLYNIYKRDGDSYDMENETKLIKKSVNAEDAIHFLYLEFLKDIESGDTIKAESTLRFHGLMKKKKFFHVQKTLTSDVVKNSLDYFLRVDLDGSIWWLNNRVIFINGGENSEKEE